MGSRGCRGRWRKCHEDGLAARVRHDLTGLLPRAAHFDILDWESPRQTGAAKARRVPGSPGAEQTTRVEREAVGSRCAPIRPSLQAIPRRLITRVQIPFDSSRLCSRRPTTYGAAVPRTTLDSAVPSPYRDGGESARFAALADGSGVLHP